MAGVVLQASADDTCDLSWTTRLLSGIILIQIEHQHCFLNFLAACCLHGRGGAPGLSR